MATIQRFEDIEAWKRARQLTKGVYDASKLSKFARDFGLKDQIQRAAVSIMSNIAEGFERGGNQEFVQYLATSKGSCGEVRSQLYVALDQGYIDEQLFGELYRNAEAISKMLSAFMDYLKKSGMRGPKYRKVDEP